MNRKFTFTTITLLFSFLISLAQTENVENWVRNVNISAYATIAETNIGLPEGSGVIFSNIGALSSGLIELDFIYHGAAVSIETAYAKFTGWKYENNNNIASSNSIFSVYGYTGKILLPKKRFQIPLYVGVGLDYVEGKPMNNLYVGLQLKARAKFYITGTMGLFTGLRSKYMYSTKSPHKINIEEIEKYDIDANSNLKQRILHLGPEIGITWTW